MGIRFPGESAAYRAARDRLLEQEIELRRAMEAVAVARRGLPPGGMVPDDYAFQGRGMDGDPVDVRLSGRSGAGAPPVLRRWRHHLPGKSAGGRDHDQRPVRGADREGSRVILLQNAQDVGDLFAVTRAGPEPADHDPLADIGGCEADLEPVAHAGHLFPGRAARRRVPGPGPGAWIVAGLGAAAGSGGRLRVGDGGMMQF